MCYFWQLIAIIDRSQRIQSLTASISLKSSLQNIFQITPSEDTDESVVGDDSNSLAESSSYVQCTSIHSHNRTDTKSGVCDRTWDKRKMTYFQSIKIDGLRKAAVDVRKAIVDVVKNIKLQTATSSSRTLGRLNWVGCNQLIHIMNAALTRSLGIGHDRNNAKNKLYNSYFWSFQIHVKPSCIRNEASTV